MPDNQLEATDPRGKKIVCTEQCWQVHIIGTRPWLAGHEKDVVQAIEKPDAIFQDATHRSRQNYYLLNDQRTSYLKVVVQFRLIWGNEIVTVIKTSNVKSSEKLIWIRSKLQ